LTDIFENSVAPSAKSDKIEINLVKNEFEGVNLGIKSAGSDLSNVKVTIKPITAKAPSVKAYAIGYVYNSNTSFMIDKNYMRNTSPNDFPEYYKKSSTIGDVTKNKCASAYIEAGTTKSSASGSYNYEVIISSSQGDRVLPLTVNVYNVTIPDPKDSQFSYTAFTNMGIFTGGNMDVMNETFYSAKDFNANFWTVQKNNAIAMKKQRQNTIYVPLDYLLKPDMKVNSDGTYSFNWTKFDKYVSTYLTYGSIKYLEGQHLFDKDWYINPTPKDFPTNSCDTWVFYNNGGKVDTKWVFSDTPASDKHLNQLLPALYQHLKTKGWDKLWLQHVADECHAEVQRKQIEKAYKLIHQLMPGVRTIDAGSDLYPRFEGSLDIMVPQVDNYDAKRVAYQNVNNTATDVWTYTCVNPQGRSMSRIGDFPLISTRIIGWYCYQQKLGGYLHWAWNYWVYGNVSPMEPFKDMSCPNAAMDAWLVYPDYANLGVLDGVRSSAVRDGWEDYELLQLAYKRDAAKTSEIANKSVKWSTQFERTSSELMKNRLELIRIAAG
jgi:hypothetical protein